MSTWNIRFADNRHSSTDSLAEKTPDPTLPPAHLSIELGHLYPIDWEQGPDNLGAYFRRLGRLATAEKRNYKDRTGVKQPRISTCFMIDDYMKKIPDPEVTINEILLPAAAKGGITIDYIGREAGCAQYTKVLGGRERKISPVGDLLATLVEPAPITFDMPMNLRQRPVETGWLPNGDRSVVDAKTGALHKPSLEWGALGHSIFTDIELFDGSDEKRWACPTLAATWQAARLGLLRNNTGLSIVAEPVSPQSDGRYAFEGGWENLPPLMQLNPEAASFETYTALSILPRPYLAVEHAVSTILNHMFVNPALAERMESFATKDTIQLAPTVAERVEYTFTNAFNTQA